MNTPIVSDLLREALAAIKEWARLHTTLLSNVTRLVDAARAVLGKIGATPEGQALRIALAGLDLESSLPLCARCGLVHVVGQREEMPVCPTCEAAVLRDLLTDRERQLTALREAAGELVDTLAASGGGRQCATCYSLATVGDPLPHGGAVFRCDKHASPPPARWEDDPMESHPTKAAAPLRALLALLERKS